jgi:hypothetical protein
MCSSDTIEQLEKLSLEDVPDEERGCTKRVEWLKINSTADVCERMKLLEEALIGVYTEQCVLQNRFNQLKEELQREKILEDQKGSFTK